jgi:uncharacterized protein (DUF2252 family)
MLEEQTSSRVPELVPIRYGRMLASPFAFYRGAANVMAHDLAPTPRSGLEVQLCGDAHLANFGSFATPERNLVFSINDFDETLPGPFEWDVKRLAASFEIAGRSRGFSVAECRSAVLSALRSYRNAMSEFATLRDLDVWHASVDESAIETRLKALHDKKASKNFERTTAKARTKDNLRAFAKLTHEVDGEPRIVSDPPLIVPIEELLGDSDELEELEAALRSVLRKYSRTLQYDRRILIERYRPVDLARKVVGVGSVGTGTWIALLLGRDDDDPLFLQVKEAQPSVLEPVLAPSVFANHGRRVVEGQRLMQAASDILLGWTRSEDLDDEEHDFYVRQLWDWKSSLDVDSIVPAGLVQYAQLCGWTLARAHARSGDRIAIAAYLGAGDVFDRAIAEFAGSYADLNERDYGALRRAVDDRRLAAEEGV